MATHSSVLAWRVPGTGEPGGLPSMGSHRVGHDWSDLAAAAAVAKSCPALCNPMNCSTPGFPVLHCLLEFAQTHVHWAGDAIQLFYPLSPSSPPALNLSQHQGLFQWKDQVPKYWSCVTHSSVLAWRIPGTGEPGGLPSMGSHRVGHDWSDLAAAAAAAV